MPQGSWSNFSPNKKKETGCGLPHRHHIPVEHVTSGAAGVPANQIIIHTFWGGRANRPFAMAFEAAWEKRFSQQLDVFADNNCLYFMLPNDISDLELLSMVSSANLETLIRKRLEGSGFFGARFRECAGRALLISRKKINERMPLWISRLKSKKLIKITPEHADEELIAALEQAPGIIRALYGKREILTLESLTRHEHSHNHLLVSEKKICRGRGRVG